MKNILKFFEYFMDETSNKIGDSSTEELTVTRIKNGFRLFANNFVIEIKDNPVPSLDRIKVGKICPTDSTMLLDDKEYSIESNAWNIISLLKDDKLGLLLDYVYKNFDKDLIQNGVETKKS
jgi:hypothetical protein